MTTTLKSAAEKYVEPYPCNEDDQVCSHDVKCAFLAGAAFERARILELLRSNKGSSWAIWLEEEALKEMDGDAG